MKLRKTQWEELKVIILIFLKYILLGTLYLWTTKLLLSSLGDLLERNHIEHIDQFTFGAWLFVISYIIYALGTPFYIMYNFFNSHEFYILNNRMTHMTTSNV